VPDWPDLLAPVEQVAPRLLGALLRHDGVAVRITEVEAYAGTDDPASHAFRGPTRRNATMHGDAGHLYCYFTYGMHVCANVVTGEPGVASAVLLRAGEVVEGVDLARTRRGAVPDDRLARGPANLCRALGLGLADDGSPLDGSTGTRLALTDPGPGGTGVRRGPRVGVRAGWATPWRWWYDGDPTVSAYRRHPRADAAVPGLEPGPQQGP